jgi:hypothetical protein
MVIGGKDFIFKGGYELFFLREIMPIDQKL